MVEEQNSNYGKSTLEHLLQNVPPQLSVSERQKLQQQWQQAIAYLITNNFAQLVQLLYRVDVDEKQLKSLLHQEGQGDAAAIIAALLLERQHQKAVLRQQYSQRPADDKEEGW